METLKIVVVDGDRRDALRTRAVLACQRDFEVAGLCADGYEALSLVQGCAPDAAVSELCLKYSSGAEIVPLLRGASPGTRLVVFTRNEDDALILEAVRGGAADYLLKDRDMDILPRCVREVAGGGVYFTPPVAHAAVRLLAEGRVQPWRERWRGASGWPGLPEGLTATEARVLGGLACGMTDGEIALALGLREGSVRNCVSRVVGKTGTRSRVEAALLASHNGLGRGFSRGGGNSGK